MPERLYVVCARVADFDPAVWPPLAARVVRRRCHNCNAEVWYDREGSTMPYDEREFLVCKPCLPPHVRAELLRDLREGRPRVTDAVWRDFVNYRVHLASRN